MLQLAQHPRAAAPTFQRAALGQDPGQDTKSSSIAALINEINRDIISPTAAKSPFQFHSSVPELRAELRRTCPGSSVEASTNLGEFLRLVDCGLDEALSWWTEIESIGFTTAQVGQSMIQVAAANIAGEGAVSEAFPPETINLLEQVSRDLLSSNPERAIAFTQLRAGKTFVDIGNTLVVQAQEWRTLIREINKVSPIIRDLVLAFNAGIDDGSIPDTPQTEALRVSLEQLVKDWKFQIAMRPIDAGFFVRKFALDMQAADFELIRAQFKLGALNDELLSLTDSLIQSLAEANRTLDRLMAPGEVIAAMGRFAKKFIKGGVKAVTDPFVELLKDLLIIAGVTGGVLVGGAIVMKKTGIWDDLFGGK